MRSFPKSAYKSFAVLAATTVGILSAGWLVTARGSLPDWIRNVEAHSELEAIFFRAMPLPGGDVLYRRPPKEARTALDDLLHAQPPQSEIYALRAKLDEEQLDFAAAETDWKQYAAVSTDKTDAQLALADFFHRRLRPQDEIATLSALATAPPDAIKKSTPANQQHAWTAFERIFTIIQAQGLPSSASDAQYRAWLARYPQEASLYSRYLDFLIAQKNYAGADQLIAAYAKQFPRDEIFPVQAKALLEVRQGSVEQGLAVYEKTFQPLWPPELVKGYFDLLAQTQRLRKFLDDARARINAHPGDLTATARVFYYYQQQGKLDAAEQAITSYRQSKENAKSAFTSSELATCAALLESIHAYPEAARYYFALYNSANASGAAPAADAQQRALSGLVRLLLTAPEMPIRLGTGELSMYKDIATMDQGPGYLNGILSLLLNTESPSSEYPQEEQRAIPYFHRSRAAELLALLDAKYPQAPDRAVLHVQLLEFYASVGESAAVLNGSEKFLAAFTSSSDRTTVSLLMADADARTGNAAAEFAIYDRVLKELAANANKIPLGESGGGASSQNNAQAGAHSPEYARVLERYLARLVELQQIPQALAVLRRELDQNPDDPGLYDRLATFLDQNRLGAEQEDVYRRALARFSGRNWYHKLARYYLRQKQESQFEVLTREAVKVFSGSELESYFQDVVHGSPQLYVQLNLFAHARFPHNPAFVHNLLNAYHSKPTWDDAAWEALIRQHWFEEADLRNQFFEYLSRNGQLESELKALQASTPSSNDAPSELAHHNPAAAHFIAESELWRSHFEQSVPVLQALAAEYPADLELNREASSVLRSLAYFDATNTNAAVKIEENLLAANPGSTEILERIGDIYADRELFTSAAPYWERIPKAAPGESAGYLEAATVYWDYYDFDNALRLLADGRKRIGHPHLYGYEAGAIYEGTRDYSKAIGEYASAAIDAGPESPAANRLLELAVRPKFRELVDRQTAALAPAESADLPAITLRVRVLEAQGRKPELTAFLDAAVKNASTIEQAAALESLAQQKSLEDVRQHALEKQAALATDPVTRLQLRYALVRLYEGRKDLVAAQRNVEALYRDNPKILGVVRSTVDFYWRSRQQPQAIAVLLQAAKDAYASLGKQFTFEAARKSTEAHRYSEARDLLAPLLNDDPYNGEYLAAAADTYARAGDQQGLKDFYLAKIALFRNAPLAAEDRKARIAALRRGLLPALTQLADYAGAIDQYIEIINTFPEDEGLISEAALYSARHQRQRQLLDYYAKTIQQSPSDYRWSMVLARAQANLENYPAAIAAYDQSIHIRPDRVDLRIARAALAERLMHFDDAAADYERVYELAYKDPQWMEKIAEIRARQGRNADAAAALKIALIDVAPKRAATYFEAARRLESWNLLEGARGFAEQGIALAGGDLLAAGENHNGVVLYARILTRLRQPEKVNVVLQRGVESASAALPVLGAQIAKQGISGITDQEWRSNLHNSRVAAARQGLRNAFIEIGAIVARYYTPEEKLKFAQFAESLRAPMNFTDANDFAIPLAQSAGLADLEAQWRYQCLMECPLLHGQAYAQLSPLMTLQNRRLKFAELGPQLEHFASRLPLRDHAPVLLDAAEAYHHAGDSENEMRILSASWYRYMRPAQQQRYLAFLLTHRPEELVKLASDWSPWSEGVSAFVFAHADPQLAHEVVAARGKQRAPVWSASYNALTGLYFAEPAQTVNAAFLSALGDHTIGDRLGKSASRDEQLAGDIWFYYGSRYGEYLSATKQGVPDDFLPAPLEQSPATSSRYLALADYYAERGELPAAVRDYQHSLELSPKRADVHDRLAMVYFRQGHKPEAIAEWKLFFSTLARQADSPNTPENLGPDFAQACEHVRTRRLFADLRTELDSAVRAALHRNGTFGSNEILRSEYLAIGNPAAATPWLLDISSAAPDPVAVLADLADVPWIPLAQRAPLYRRVLEAKQNAANKSEGVEQEGALEDFHNWQVRWAKLLLDSRQYDAAAVFVNMLPAETKRSQASALVPIELQAAARLGNLDALIAAYLSDASSAPAAEILRAAARDLAKRGDKVSAQKILEFVFTREIAAHQLLAADFLGLAEIRLSSGDTAGALELLRRLVLVVGAPYENLDSAAALLEKNSRPAEALDFLEQLVKSAPWEASYRLRLAVAQSAANKDAATGEDTRAAIASDPLVPYSVRVQSAKSLSGARPKNDFGSREIALLAGDLKKIPIHEADQPFFYDARLAAAQTTQDVAAKRRILVNTLADTPSREDARVSLFETVAARHEDNYALAVIASLLPANREASRYRGDASEGDANDASDNEPANSPAAPASPLDAIPLSEKLQVLQSVSDIFVRQSQLPEAALYLTILQKLQSDPAQRRATKAKIAVIRGILHTEELNAARQPILHQELEQNRVVRPRLAVREISANISREEEVKP